MRICKITHIKPDGKPWDSQYGTMYPFYVILEDGGAGTTNSKTPVPPYKVGDSVGYDIVGTTPKGVAKVKITRNPKPGEGTVWTPDTSNPELEAAQPAPQSWGQKGRVVTPPAHQNSPAASGTPVNGQTVGMAVKAAIDIAIYTEGIEKGGWGQSSIAIVEGIARDIVAMSERIQNGQ